MIMFNACINFIESFLFCYFIAKFLKLNNTFKFITLTTIIQFIILTFFQFTDYNGFLLTSIVVIFMMTSVCLSKKVVIFNDLYIVLLYNSFILVCAIIGNIIVQFINISSVFKLDAISSHIIVCIIPKSLQLFFTLLILKKSNNVFFNLDIQKWSHVISFEFVFVALIALLGYEINSGNMLLIMDFILFLVLILGVLFLSIILNVDKIYVERIRLAKENENAKFNKQKYSAITNVKMDVEKIDHRLFYTVYKIEDLLNRQEYNQIYDVLNHYKMSVLKYKLIIDTKNDVFDTLYSLKINNFVSKGINVNNFINISNNEKYNDLVFINSIMKILDFYDNCELLEIMISEVNDYIIVNIIHRNGNVDIDELCNNLDSISSKINLKYNASNIDKKGLRAIFEMSEENDK